MVVAEGVGRASRSATRDASSDRRPSPGAGRDRGDSGMATNAFIELNLAEANKLADYTSIEYDLRTAREFAATMVSEYQKPSPNYSLCDPFMVAAIIRYARAFSEGVRLKLYEEGVSTLTDEQRSK